MVVTLPRTLVHGEVLVPKLMALMEATVAGLPVALCIVPDADDVVHVIGMLAVSTMFPLLVAAKLAGDGVTVHTVEGTAEAGATVMPNAAAPAPAMTAILLIDFFMALELSSGVDRRRKAVSGLTEGGGRTARGSGKSDRGQRRYLRETWSNNAAVHGSSR
ncbi:hypothetical protein GCM10010420_17690 [Streptomyces glaucosporus]|uniref:Uncharacterized protein n=1 Tax=Streptomyces glaucosporus TaxID=284044 RepID=A0ABN3I2F1_9ACTN